MGWFNHQLVTNQYFMIHVTTGGFYFYQLTLAAAGAKTMGQDQVLNASVVSRCDDSYRAEPFEWSILAGWDCFMGI